MNQSLFEKPLLVLAMDTSTDMLACAVAHWMPDADGLGAQVEVLASGDHLCRRQTNVELTSTALDCLQRAGYTMDDVDAVLVGRGPGSFTGVRIGIATAKGVACGLGCPLHGTSTLDAAAWNAWLHGERGLVGVVGDAMRGEVYPGIYVLDDEGPMRTFPTETVIKAKACVDEWAARRDRDELILTGDGLKKYKAQFDIPAQKGCCVLRHRPTAMTPTTMAIPRWCSPSTRASLTPRRTNDSVWALRSPRARRPPACTRASLASTRSCDPCP